MGGGIFDSEEPRHVKSINEQFKMCGRRGNLKTLKTSLSLRGNAKKREPVSGITLFGLKGCFENKDKQISSGIREVGLRFKMWCYERARWNCVTQVLSFG